MIAFESAKIYIVIPFKKYGVEMKTDLIREICIFIENCIL